MEKDFKIFYPKNNKEWRLWLDKNHVKEDSIWLGYYKQKTNVPSIKYSDAVDIALCYGWIDSRVKPIDDEKFMQFFCKRKPKSVWSKINKDKVERLISEGKMTKAGFDSIEIAKLNGSWTILDEAEALIIPADLENALTNRPGAKAYFMQLSKSDKRNILQWLTLAKRPDTRQKRVLEIAELAEQQQKPKQFRGAKSGT